MGGVDRNGVYLDDVWLLDPSSFQWTNLNSPAPLKLARACAVAEASYIYIFGGQTSSSTMNNIFFRYHVKQRVWEKIAEIQNPVADCV